MALVILDYLEKNLSKLSSSDLNKNRPNGEFMEKILLDRYEWGRVPW